MSTRNWLMRQNPARRPRPGGVQMSESFARLVEANTTERTAAPVAAVKAEPAPEDAPRLTEAAVPPARTAATTPRLVVPVGITPITVRCGCWPRYTGGCYCSKEGQ